MQLFELNPESEKISLGKEIKPIKFRDVRASNNQNGKEKDIETIIAENPAILNYSENDFDSADLLIISRQLASATNKKADLVALDRDGYLITIEIKRDAIDEKNRSECMEFQSIRYAATHRTLDVTGIINIYAQYLKSLPEYNDMSFDCCRKMAVTKVCDHLEDEETKVTEDKLADYIDPTERQKIFLVAADFAPDCLSACAWLREHNIDIYCFKLQPYNINGNFVLHQERLIPPVALDDFYIGTKEAKEKEKQEQNTRKSSVKPEFILWGEDKINCNKWNSLLTTCIKRSLEAGVAIDLIPCPHTTDCQEQGTYHNAGTVSYKSKEGNTETVYIDRHGSRAQITDWVQKILACLNTDIAISVTLQDGSCEILHGEGAQQSSRETCC